MRSYLSYLLGIFISLMACTQAAAIVIAVTPPPPREVIVIPKGHTKCVTVAAGMYDGVYVNEHKVCHYSNSAKNTVWIAGHWQCNNYRPLRGVCVSWAWIPSQWATKTIVVL